MSDLRTDIVRDGVITTLALEDGALISGTTQDCDPIADWCQEQHNSGGGSSPTGELKHAARVPFVFIEKYLHDNHIGMGELARSQDHQRRLLGDPALAHFRIWKGRI